MASSMASTTIGSNSPLTCSTSTGPGSSAVVLRAAGAPAAPSSADAGRGAEQADR